MAKSKWPHIQENLDKIADWTKSGYLEKDICIILGISKSTWEKHKREQPALSALLKREKSHPNGEVINSLYKNAIGFYYYEDAMRTVKDADGNENVVVVSLKKWSPGQVSAQAIWLKNKMRDEWSDNPQLIDLRKREFDHKKKMDERNNW